MPSRSVSRAQTTIAWAAADEVDALSITSALNGIMVTLEQV